MKSTVQYSRKNDGPCKAFHCQIPGAYDYVTLHRKQNLKIWLRAYTFVEIFLNSSEKWSFSAFKDGGKEPWAKEYAQLERPKKQILLLDNWKVMQLCKHCDFSLWELGSDFQPTEL